MLSQTFSKLPIETVNWESFCPAYPFRFNGPGYLYCVGCEHFVRLVAVSTKTIVCSECARVLANA